MVDNYSVMIFLNRKEEEEEEEGLNTMEENGAGRIGK